MVLIFRVLKNLTTFTKMHIHTSCADYTTKLAAAVQKKKKKKSTPILKYNSAL